MRLKLNVLMAATKTQEMYGNISTTSRSDDALWRLWRWRVV